MNIFVRCMSWRLPLLALALCCTSCASLSGAWYYQTGDRNDSQNLFLAVVNDIGSMQSIAALDVNASGDRQALGWRCAPPSNDPVDLAPGQLLVVSLPAHGEFQCAVPTRVRATLCDGGTLNFKLPRSMPTALPDAWRKTCLLHPSAEGDVPKNGETRAQYQGARDIDDDAALRCTPYRGETALAAGRNDNGDDRRITKCRQ